MVIFIMQCLRSFHQVLILLLEDLGWIAEWKMMCDVFAAVSVVLQHTGLQLQIV